MTTQKEVKIVSKKILKNLQDKNTNEELYSKGFRGIGITKKEEKLCVYFMVKSLKSKIIKEVPSEVDGISVYFHPVGDIKPLNYVK